jgi:hypothetical protein
VDYLLSGKLFCGPCGSSVIGMGGRGRCGDMFYYYACRARRMRSGCAKAHEKKDFLEWYVVEQTVEYVLTPSRMEYIAQRVAEQYEAEFNDGRIKEMERRVAKLDRDIEKFTEAALEMPSASRKLLYEKIERAGEEKTDVEIDLAKMRIASRIRYTEKEIIVWLKTFCDGDLFDEAFRRRIIDTFINTVYLYDDKLVIFYNIKGGKQVSYMEMLAATEDIPDFDDEPDFDDDLESPPVKGKRKSANHGNVVRASNDMVGQQGFEPGTP